MAAINPKTHRFVVSVLVPDGVGILRDITRVVLAQGGNIGHIRQTVVGGFFHLIFTSDHPETLTPKVLKQELLSALSPDAEVVVRDCPETQPALSSSGPNFVVMTRGYDKPGAIYAITSFLVGHEINIEDWFVEDDCGKVVYIAQVKIPETVNFRQLQTSFKEAMAKHGLSAMIFHENIFRATNEIGPIKSLLERE